MAPSSAGDDVGAELAEALAQLGGVRLAVLFGSRARGAGREGSDLDLAVAAPGLDLCALAATLTARLGIEVDVVRLEDATIPLLEALIRDGVVVFEGERGAAASWRSRALVELETDLPWYRRMREAWLEHVARGGLGDGG